MPNIPQTLDFPRKTLTSEPANPEQIAFEKALTFQWVRMVQAFNALLHVDTAANMPATPMLDEILFYEQDTGRSYVAVSGNWIHLSPWSGRTVAVSTTYTMESTDAIILGSASASGSITITITNGSAYTSRLRCVKKVDASTQSVFVSPSSGTIDGAVSFNLSSQYQSIIFTSDGTNLHIVGENT